jgi:hypothetical protein
MYNNKQAIVIHRIRELTRDVDYYAKMFPDNHFTLQELINQVKKDALSLGGEFGYSVSGEWKERCYCFKVLARDTELVEIEYIGIGKV